MFLLGKVVVILPGEFILAFCAKTPEGEDVNQGM